MFYCSCVTLAEHFSVHANATIGFRSELWQACKGVQKVDKPRIACADTAIRLMRGGCAEVGLLMRT